MTTAKEELAARVASMTEEQATEALSVLDGEELTDEERRGIIDAMDAMDHGEGSSHEQATARLLSRFNGERKHASGE